MEALYRVRTTYSVRSRNIRLRQLAASRGLVVRDTKKDDDTSCPAKVCATLQRSEGTNEWNVVVTKHFTEHNHDLSEALYLQYSEVRRVRDPEVLAQAEQL
ncbi:hypothetical protein PsorP6_015907 [Peronosclerospora sorghi]|uniref:Uncharacterized protein n=1 Tax=Peronosclerospora sorghi TaxID=230839 RepID=A0ACC0WND6_9STRA|nr:hypothetical protein PsorP6_015907 [Peronosclerospora sorghi]